MDRSRDFDTPLLFTQVTTLKRLRHTLDRIVERHKDSLLLSILLKKSYHVFTSFVLVWIK